MAETTDPAPPREGYRAEWLALEDAAGGRYQMVGDINVDCPTFDGMLSALGKQWPQHDDEIDVLNEKADSGNVRIYKPKAVSADAKLPLVVWYHGGGFICGNLDTEDAQCRLVAARLPAIVVSVDYPKAILPSVTVPVIVENHAVPAVDWARRRGAELGADEHKTILMGGSAGSLLALQVAYHFIEKGDLQSVNGLSLLFASVFPYTYSTDGEFKHMHSSWEDCGDAQVPILSRKLAHYVWSFWEVDFAEPKWFPGLASDKDLAKLPPTYICNAEMDVVRDDGTLLEWRLRNVGVATKRDFYDGLPHYFHVFPTLNAAHDLWDATLDGLRFVIGEIENAAT